MYLRRLFTLGIFSAKYAVVSAIEPDSFVIIRLRMSKERYHVNHEQLMGTGTRIFNAMSSTLFGTSRKTDPAQTLR